MIELLINSLPVDLPADFSFQMDYENEFFTKASEYSLDIELPLLGSPNNQKIFGNIHRSTTPKDNVNYEAVAYVNGRCVAHGSAIILSISDTKVRIQLVGNTSYINYFTSETYIDELDLGYAVVPDIEGMNYTDYLNTAYISKSEFYKVFGSVDDIDMVYFWAYAKDPADIDEDTFFSQRYPNSPYPTFDEENNSRVWLNQMYRYSCQPYLMRVIERLMTSLGFKIRRNDISHTWLRNLYICNYTASKLLTDDYRKINSALPHWRITEFIDEVEKLCACIFVFNTYNKTVDVIQLDKFYDETSSVFGVPDNCIIDEYEFDFSDSDSSDGKNTSFGNVSFDMNYTDKFLKMDSDVKEAIETHNHYTDYDSLLTAYNSLAIGERKKILFIDDSTGREYICFVKEDGTDEIREVNQFGDLIRDANSSSAVQLRIVPANTRLYGVGWFFDAYQGAPSAAFDIHVPFTAASSDNPDYTTAQDIIENSYTNSKGEETQCMEVMLSTGQWYETVQYSTLKLSFPVPFTDFNMPGSAKGKLPEMSLSLKDVCEQSLGHMYRNIPVYDTSKTFIFRFLSSVVPDPRQPFMFRNQRYVCRKLSADFEQNTKQMIFEGEFYRIG